LFVFFTVKTVEIPSLVMKLQRGQAGVLWWVLYMQSASNYVVTAWHKLIGLCWFCSQWNCLLNIKIVWVSVCCNRLVLYFAIRVPPKPSTSPSSTCLDLLRDLCLFIYAAAAADLTFSQQRVLSIVSSKSILALQTQ